MKRLTQEQIQDRIRMYDEAAEHLDMEVCETEGEREQSRVVAAQIRALSEKFQKKQKQGN